MRGSFKKKLKWLAVVPEVVAEGKKLKLISFGSASERKCSSFKWFVQISSSREKEPPLFGVYLLYFSQKGHISADKITFQVLTFTQNELGTLNLIWKLRNYYCFFLPLGSYKTGAEKLHWEQMTPNPPVDAVMASYIQLYEQR